MLSAGERDLVLDIVEYSYAAPLSPAAIIPSVEEFPVGIMKFKFLP